MIAIAIIATVIVIVAITATAIAINDIAIIDIAIDAFHEARDGQTSITVTSLLLWVHTERTSDPRKGTRRFRGITSFDLSPLEVPGNIADQPFARLCRLRSRANRLLKIQRYGLVVRQGLRVRF